MLQSARIHLVARSRRAVCWKWTRWLARKVISNRVQVGVGMTYIGCTCSAGWAGRKGSEAGSWSTCDRRHTRAWPVDQRCPKAAPDTGWAGILWEAAGPLVRDSQMKVRRRGPEDRRRRSVRRSRPQPSVALPRPFAGLPPPSSSASIPCGFP